MDAYLEFHNFFFYTSTPLTLSFGFIPECNSFHYSIKRHVGSRFSDRAHYNEFVESGFKSWALMGRRLVLGEKNIQNQTALRPREKGPLARGCELPAPLPSQEPLSFLWALFFSFFPFFFFFFSFLCEISVVIYPSPPFILLLHLLVIHAHT